MVTISTEEPLAVAVVEAIQVGDVATLQRLLAENSGPATVRLGDHDPDGMSRTLLHVATDWPGHFPNGAATVAALVGAGADIEISGSVLGGGPPLADAVGFAQWKAAHRLVHRGAQTTLSEAAALGLMDRLEDYFAGPTPPTPEEIDHAFWKACHGGQRRSAEYLLDRGADPNWLPAWEQLTPLDAANRSQADQLAQWLRGRGAKTATELSR